MYLKNRNIKFKSIAINLTYVSGLEQIIKIPK